jgi:hypothetical protein
MKVHYITNGLAEGSVSGFCDENDELLGSIMEFLNQLNNFYLLNKIFYNGVGLLVSLHS